MIFFLTSLFLLIGCTNEQFVKGVDTLTGIESEHNLMKAIIINTRDAPIRIIEVLAGETKGKYGLSEWRFAVRIQNVSSKGIKRYDVLFPIYDDFKEKITTVRYSEIDFTKPRQDNNHKVYSRKLDFGKGAFLFTYLEKVAFDDGTTWKTSLTSSKIDQSLK
ncbi:MAG: hypothetical protein H0Z29_12015 [Candidatus Marinimicrobia bacterium]|nr:hypothetical protein [Candidatus Neomarinimicrobiota bacterium]